MGCTSQLAYLLIGFNTTHLLWGHRNLCASLRKAICLSSGQSWVLHVKQSSSLASFDSNHAWKRHFWSICPPLKFPINMQSVSAYSSTITVSFLSSERLITSSQLLTHGHAGSHLWNVFSWDSWVYPRRNLEIPGGFDIPVLFEINPQHSCGSHNPTRNCWCFIPAAKNK